MDIIDTEEKLIIAFPIYSGAWRDPMNSCFYTVLLRLDDRYVLCKDLDGDIFVMNIPG